MIKGPQIDALPDDFRYVTAISKPQIQKLLGEGTIQLDLFTDKVCEVNSEGIRYVLRRNPVRAEQMLESRESKLTSIENLAAKQTLYMAEHPRANAGKALSKINAKIQKLSANKWLTATEKDRIISVVKDENAFSEVVLLDGCYVIKSDLPKEDADAQSLHDRYCDLEMVERLFRTMKTSHLEQRSIFVTKKTSTRGHVFVVMLALLLQRELEQAIAKLDVTVEEAISERSQIHMQEVSLGYSMVQNVPTPTKLATKILKAAKISLPTALPSFTAKVHTKKKLPSERNQ